MEDALNRVVGFIGRNFGPERETARVRLLELFDVVGTSDERVAKARQAWHGCCFSAGAVPAAEAALTGADAPRLGITHVPVQLRPRRRPGCAERLAPDASGLVRRRAAPPSSSPKPRPSTPPGASARGTPGFTTTNRLRPGNGSRRFVHRHGAADAKIGAQLAHAGRKASTYWPFSGPERQRARIRRRLGHGGARHRRL